MNKEEFEAQKKEEKISSAKEDKKLLRDLNDLHNAMNTFINSKYEVMTRAPYIQDQVCKKMKECKKFINAFLYFTRDYKDMGL